MNERIKEAVEGDHIVMGLIAGGATIVMPPGLVPAFMQLVADYAEQHREDPVACCRGVEIAILQRGLKSLSEELRANAELGERMGWAKTEGSSAT